MPPWCIFCIISVVRAVFTPQPRIRLHPSHSWAGTTELVLINGLAKAARSWHMSSTSVHPRPSWPWRPRVPAGAAPQRSTVACWTCDFEETVPFLVSRLCGLGIYLLRQHMPSPKTDNSTSCCWSQVKSHFPTPGPQCIQFLKRSH